MSKAVKKVTKLVKKVAPIAGTILGGPLGGIAGGMLSGSGGLGGIGGMLASGGGIGGLASSALGSLLSGGGKVTSQGAQVGQQGFDPASGGGMYDISIPAEVARQRSEEQLKTTLEQQKAINEARAGNIAQLGQISQGKGPSIAEAQLKAANERNLAQQLSAINAARGGATSANLRTAALARTAGGRQTAQDAASARLAEAQQAREQLFKEKMAADEGARTGTGTSFDYAVAPQRELQKKEAGDLERQRIASQERAAKGSQKSGLFGSVIGGLASAAPTILQAFSDEKAKKNKMPAAKDVKDMLDKLSAKKYEYKNPELPGAIDGQRFGILAQELAKSKMGKSIVKESPQGKMLDIEQGYGAILAAQSELNKRLNKLEKKKA